MAEQLSSQELDMRRKRIEEQLIITINFLFKNNEFEKEENRKSFLNTNSKVIKRAVCELNKILDITQEDYRRVLLIYFPEMIGSITFEILTFDNKNRVMYMFDNLRRKICKRLNLELDIMGLNSNDIVCFNSWYSDEIELFSYKLRDKIFKKEKYHNHALNPYRKFILEVSEWNLYFRYLLA